MATKAEKGLYRSQVYLGKIDGKRRYISFCAKTAKEADYLALQYKLERKEKNNPGKITVGEAIDDYIESKSNLLSPTTIKAYETYRRCYFPGLMDIRVMDIETRTIQKEVNDEAAKHSAKTVKNAYTLVISSIQRFREDYSPKITLPQEQPVQYATPDGEALSKIFAAVKGTWVEVPVLLSATLSLRASEVTGLKWTDIYEDYIHVQNARVWVTGKGSIEKGTKNASSNRKIPLPSFIKEKLNELPRNSEYVCGDITVNAISKKFSKLLKQNGLPHCRFHDLRHANASIMVMLGIPDRYAQTRGGWANGATLSKRYQQTFSAEEQRVAEKVNSYFESLLQQ